MPKAKIKQTGLLDTWGRRNRKLLNKRCVECGKIFHPKRETSKYCSRKCAWKNNGKNQQRQPSTWWTNDKGYIVGRVWINGKRVFIRKQRWIMEQYLNRPLSRHEVVHHINENKQDNRIENLEIIPFGQHTAYHNHQRKQVLAKVEKGE